jgi:hypothetical protein
MPATLMAKVEAWATANDATRSAAIRRLLELGPTVPVKPTQINGSELDNLADGAASAGDRASRKRRLLKGPEESEQRALIGKANEPREIGYQSILPRRSGKRAGRFAR